jgi:molecular chaperone GrpE
MSSMRSSPVSERREDLDTPREPTAEGRPSEGARPEDSPGGGPRGGHGAAPQAAEQPAPAPAQALQAELERMEDRYKRALADLENYRKRSAAELERRVEEARESLLRDWLEALDSVERALRMQPEDEGLRAVLSQMEAILARQGVSRLGEAGEPFNPELHEAVATRAADGVPDRTIVEVVRSGFALGGRVLRPAQVVVARREEAGS